MQSTWQALIWKEAREHRWKIAALTAVFLGTLLVGIWSIGPSPTVAFDVADGVLAAGVALAAGLLAIGIAAGEQSAGTIGLLQMLPTSTRRAAIVKLATAIAALAVPIVATLATVWLFAQLVSADVTPRGRFCGIENWYLARFAASWLGGASILLWMVAAGVNRCDEIRAAALGFVAIVFSWGALVLVAYLCGILGEVEVNEAPGYFMATSMLPAGILELPIDAAVHDAWEQELLSDRVTTSTSWFAVWLGTIWPFALAAVASHAALATWYVRRFGRVVPARLQTVESASAAPVRTAARADWLAPPRRSPVASLLWKQFRESAPMAILGAALIVGIFVVVALAAMRDAAGLGLLRREEFEVLALALWAYVGAGIALVAGVGVLMDDLKPELQTFWRSRPIAVGKWFSVKYAGGLVVTMIALLVGLIVTWSASWLFAEGGVAVSAEPDLPIIICMILALQAAVYTAAVAAMAWLRHPIYAGILALASPMVFVLVISPVANRLSSADRPLPEILLGLAIAACIAALIAAAWYAVKHDRGWKH
ncbi:MAG: hypothetical protein KDA44_22075 [Planctomycetales bacterium]|nr:hypothetical protein [Planctomycetales bacterium]